MTGALYPAVCAFSDRDGLLYESLVKSNRLALMWAVPFGVGLTFFCGDLVRFGIGERWHPAIVVLQVYGIAAAINHIGFNWTAYFRAVGEHAPARGRDGGGGSHVPGGRDPAAARARAARIRDRNPRRRGWSPC